MTLTTTTSATSDVSLLIEAINLNRATTHTNHDNEDDAIVRLRKYQFLFFGLFKERIESNSDGMVHII